MVSLAGIVVNLVIVIFFELNIFYMALQRTQFYLQKNIEKMKSEILMKIYNEVIQNELYNYYLLENNESNLNNTNTDTKHFFTKKLSFINSIEGLIVRKDKERGILFSASNNKLKMIKNRNINMNIIHVHPINKELIFNKRKLRLEKLKRIILLIDYSYNELEIVRNKINSIYFTSSYITKFLKFLEWAYINDIKRIDKFQLDSEIELNFINIKLEYMKNYIKNVELMMNFEIKNSKLQIL